MLNRFALMCAGLVAAASTSFAADLPSRKAPVPYAMVPVFTWTGFYVGANAGYAFTDSGRVATTGNNGPLAGPSTQFNVATGARPPQSTVSPEGFTGGGQIGYNYQIGAVVLGIEADAAYTDMRQTRAFTGTTGAVSSYKTDLSYIGTVRGRVGYAFDRLMVYGTGGLAYGDVSNSGTFFATPAAGGTSVVQFAGAKSDTKVGWTAGGGVEYALPTNFSLFNSNAVTIKAEALYYDLGRSSVTVGDTGLAPAAVRGQSYNARFENTGMLARAGVNFKFGTF